MSCCSRTQIPGGNALQHIAAQHQTRERMASPSEIQFSAGWFTPANFSQHHMYLLCVSTSDTVYAEGYMLGLQQTHVLSCAIRTSVPDPLMGTFR